jgi:hypothetical protein
LGTCWFSLSLTAVAPTPPTFFEDLIAEHKRNCGIGYERPQAQIAKEINRRILSHAERFVFSPRKDDWIDIVAQKRDPYLSRNNWA